MSTETHVFFRGKLPSKAALGRAMKELDFPFSLKPATGSLEQQSGFMPMLRRREETGVEFDVYADHAAVEEFAAQGVDPSFERRASFRWSGDFQEAVAGMCAAAALAKMMNGVMFDEAEGKLLSPDEAVALARRNLETLLQPEEKPRLGTRPADIKRYLKPLLKQRSDLALLGRLLIIRPVRHLLRGVYFEATGDKYGFYMVRYVAPLFPVDGGFGYRSRVHRMAVWEPHFNELLFDALAEDIFDRVAEISSLSDFASKLDLTALEGRDRFQHTRVAAFVLGGQPARAAELIESIGRSDPDRPYVKTWVKTQRAFLDRDIGSVCAEFHAREAESAKELKLGKIWEPAPFPAEIAEAEWATRCAEPHFITSPWIPRPPGLTSEPPTRAGEVCFATQTFQRKGHITMCLPLSREQAEERHRTCQSYVLATRLDGGNLLLLHHYTGWSPHDPEHQRHIPSRTFHLTVYGELGRLHTWFPEDFHVRGTVVMFSVDVYGRDDHQLWQAHNILREGKKLRHDYRKVPKEYVSEPLSDSDIALCRFQEPAFGEFAELFQRVERYLKNEGFGTFT